MTVTYHSGRRIQGTQADFDGTPAVSGGWKELGRTSNSSLPDVTSLADKRYLMFLNFQESNASRPAPAIRVNGDLGTNYARRGNAHDGVGDYTNTSQTRIMFGGQPQGDTTTVPYFTVGYIANLAGKEKLAMCNNALSYQLGAGSSEPLERRDTVFKWANTSDAVDQLSIVNHLGSGSFNTNGELVVLGWDPDDTHTDNFWEELVSVENSGGSTNNFGTGSFTAKKYLWIQAFVKNDGLVEPRIRVGTGGSIDTGSNIATRSSSNGGADGTATSRDDMVVSISGTSENHFINMFMVNNASNEKLAIHHCVSVGTAGAGTAPQRREGVSKYSNTSAQVNTIEIEDNAVSAGIANGTFIKVWGAD